MNIWAIDPAKKSRPAAWGRDDVFESGLDDDPAWPEPEPECDDRFDLLMDLRSLFLAYLRSAAGMPRLEARAAALERDVETLRSLAADAEYLLSPRPRVDLAAGFSALAAQAGVADFDPHAAPADLLTGALALNSLCLAVVQAFAIEPDAGPWRPALLLMLAEDSRFEGWLDAALDRCGEEAIARAAEVRALAATPVTGTKRLWSFDLLRMAISRLVCGGHAGHRGGFFPHGMSGPSSGQGAPLP